MMSFGYNVFASIIVAALFLSLGLVVRQAANQPIDQMFGAGWIISFAAIFIFCMVTLSYNDKKEAQFDADEQTKGEKQA
jgi:membrane protein DedA with SNARE-associated domain